MANWVWENNNAKIITWINNSLEQSIGVHLAKFSTDKRYGLTNISMSYVRQKILT